MQGKTARALGDIIYLSGTVRDQHCAAVPNVVVEIWQACTSGRYNHPGDESDSPLDPNFQYWGIVSTDTSGSYRFKTIIPGHYYASANWIRPPHIHYKVHKKGYRELVTQMYFAGNQYNDGDLILKGIPEAERGQVVRNLNPRPGEEGRNCFDISFDLTIHRIG